MRATWMAIVGMLAAAGCGRESIESFTELDRNDDSRISREEARADPALALEFSDIDGNSDGELSAGEYLQAAREAY